MAKKGTAAPQDLTLRNNRARQKEIAELRHRLRETNDRIVNLKTVIGTALSWIATTAGSPLGKEHLENLLEQLDKV